MHSWRPTAKRSPRPRAYKVVLAGEWHLTPDGVRAAAVPASLTSPRPFAEEEPAPMPAKKKAPALKADAKVEEIRAAYRREQEEARRLAAAKAGAAVTTEPLVAGALEPPTTPAPAATTPFHLPIDDPTTPAAPAAGRRRRTRPVPGTLPTVTPLPAPKKRAPPSAAEDDKPPKMPCFGGASVETLEAIESRFLGATLPAQ